MNSRRQFSVNSLMWLMAMLSVIVAAMFAQSGTSILFCIIVALVLTSCFCLTRKCSPELLGSAIGFIPAAILALSFIGEMFIQPPPGVYYETDLNVAIAIVLISVVGGFGALVGSLVGTVYAIVAEID